MLQLVLGASGTGKSSRLFSAIQERAARGQHSMLLVPEQFTSSTESRIYTLLGDKLSGYVNSYSFSSLAEKILASYGGAAVPTLTDAGRAVLLRRALESMGDHLSYYSRHRRNTAFCEKCAQTLDEFKSAGVSASELAELAGSSGTSAEKLNELAAIFAAYEALLADSAMDPTDRQITAAERVQPDFFADCAIFVDEFDTFNVPKQRLLEQMLAFGSDVTITLCTDGMHDTEGGVGLFSGAKKMAAALHRLARKQGVSVAKPIELTTDWRHKNSPTLTRLAALLCDEEMAQPAKAPCDDSLTLYAADTRHAEAKQVAAAINALARKGIAYKDMAVICRDSSQYLASIRYEFRLAGIPRFFDEATTAEHAAPVRLVKALFSLLRRGLCTEALLGAAKTGLTSLSEEQLCALENYAYTWQMNAAAWREEFVRSPSGFGSGREMMESEAQQLALAEEARSWLVPKLDRFVKNARGKTAAELCVHIYKTMQGLGCEEQIKAVTGQLKQTEGILAAEESMRVWNVTGELLNQMVLLLGDEVLPATELHDLFDLLVRTTDLGQIPQTLDSVIFTTAGRMRLDNPRHCFVLGLGEGEFPKTPGETGLLTHAERDALIAQNIELPDCFENRMVREQVCFYKALTAASEGVWLSWASGTAALPMTDALAPVVLALDPALPRMVQADLAFTPAAALDVLGSEWNVQSPTTAALYEVLSKTPDSQSLLAPLTRAATKGEYRVNDTGAMQQLLGDSLKTSPSRMEKYYACPFGYFMEYVLGARPRKQAALTADQSGNLIHYILEQALVQAGDGFLNMTEEELTELAARIASDYVKQNMPGDTARFGYLISRLKRSAAALLLHIQAERRQGRFVPVAFEMGIGYGENEVRPVTLTTADGHRVRMSGKIDRVDAYTEGDTTWLRVVDYKTGSKEFLLEDVQNGLNCQMLVYLFTLTRNGDTIYKNPSPAGVLYLMADPAPARGSRQEAQKALNYQVEGLVVDEPDVVSAMDSGSTGLYVPLKFDKDGNPRQSQALASLTRLNTLQQDIDGLIVQMAEKLYQGEIAAEPLGAGKKKQTQCIWCDYRNVCGQQQE